MVPRFLTFISDSFVQDRLWLQFLIDCGDAGVSKKKVFN